MNVSSEFVNWLLIGGCAIFAAAMGLNHLALLESRRRKRVPLQTVAEQRLATVERETGQVFLKLGEGFIDQRFDTPAFDQAFSSANHTSDDRKAHA